MMSRFLLAAIVVIFAYASCASAQAPSSVFTCNSTRFDQCMTTFATTLNLTSMTPYMDTIRFRAQIEDYYRRGVFGGFLDLCRAFRTFKDCVNIEYFDCMSIPHFVLSGVTNLEAAYDFVSVFYQQHFVCGAGFDIYLRNEDCISSTWSQHRTHFDDCYREYYAQVQAGGIGAGCVAGRMLSECFEGEFIHSCPGKRADVGWWGCEYGRTMMFTQFPQCTQDCTTLNIGGI